MAILYILRTFVVRNNAHITIKYFIMIEQKKKCKILRTMYCFAIYTTEKEDPYKNLDLRIHNMVKDQFDMVREFTQRRIEPYVKYFMERVFNEIEDGKKPAFFEILVVVYVNQCLRDIMEELHL